MNNVSRIDFSARPTPFMPLVDARFLRASAECRCADSDDNSNGEILRFLETAEYFSSGRDALSRAVKLARLFGKTLWLPKYFCPWVVKNLSAAAAHEGARISFFDDFPTQPAPDFSTLKADCGDAVLAVDFFGTRGFRVWDEWKKSNPDTVLIADASHAPFSLSARNCNADFVCASLRKTLPVPDGGYLRAANREPAKMFRSGGELAEFAAVYIQACALARFDYPRAEDFYYNSEMRLNAKRGISRIGFYSRSLLASLDFARLWRAREECIAEFCDALYCGAKARLLRDAANSGGFSAFCPTLVFDSTATRDAAYAALARAGALCSIYWSAKFLTDPAAKKEASFLMTVPLDFRHTPADARLAAKIISAALE